MAATTTIEWADATWNPVIGCTKVSPGCAHCYAERQAERWRGSAGYPNGFDPVTLKPKKLSEPARWKDPKIVFVNSMSDLFHEEIPDEFLKAIWNTMIQVDHHAYLILTKRPVQMLKRTHELGLGLPPQIWLGVSAENQRWFDQRVPVLAAMRAAVRFVSIEPMLGPVSIAARADDLDWVIVGAESGPERRPFELDWAREVREECQVFGVDFMYKQGSHRYPDRERMLDGRTWDERPEVRK